MNALLYGLCGRPCLALALAVLLAVAPVYASDGVGQKPAPPAPPAPPAAPATPASAGIQSGADAWQAISEGDLAAAETWALAQLKDALAAPRENAPRLDVAYRLLSEIRFRQGNFADAAAYAGKIPNQKARQGALGCVLYAQGRVAEAIPALRASLLPPPTETHSAPSSDPAWAAYYLGEALLATGKAAEAKEILARFVEDMGQADVRPFFYERKFRELRLAAERALGLACRATADDDGAKTHLSNYRRLAALPEAQGLTAAAQLDESETLLRGYGVNIKSLLPAPADKDWYITVNAGFAYDTNPLGLPDDPIILPDSILEDAQDTWRFDGFLAGGYRFLHRERFQLWADYSLAATANFDADRADYQQHMGGIRAIWQVSDVWRAGAQVAYEGVLVDADSYRETLLVRPFISYRWADWTATVLEYTYQRQEYFLDVIDEQDRDGDTHIARLSQVARVPGTELELRVGVERGATDSAGNDWDYYWEAARVRARHPIAWGIYGNAGYVFAHESFVHKQSAKLFQGRRVDHRHQVSLSLDREICEHVTATVGWVHTEDHSSVDRYRYDEDVFSVGVGLRF